MTKYTELLRVPARHGEHLYDTRVERDVPNEAFWITQVREPGTALDENAEVDEMVYLDENAARAVYLTLKNHFEA
ncbi:hypothetical protein [Burkholderia cenocepacia]